MSMKHNNHQGEYKVLVVDPPWPLRKIERKVRPNQVGFDYPMMSLEEIRDFKLVRDLAAPDSMCFLWAVQKYLPDAFNILADWGFRYARTLTWDKQNGLVLQGFHNRTEFVLVGYKGHSPVYLEGNAVPPVFAESSWRKHSVKPDIFYSLIERFGEPRIDIFARRYREGWDVWGDEVKEALP